MRYSQAMLRQYVYISTAPGLGSEDIDNILESCQRNNLERGITGLLLYNGRNFLQLLEGAENDLRWVMRRISADPRHSGISVLDDMACEQRACPDWTMQRIRLVDDLEQRRDTLEAELPSVLDPQIRRVILNFAALN